MLVAIRPQTGDLPFKSDENNRRKLWKFTFIEKLIAREKEQISKPLISFIPGLDCGLRTGWYCQKANPSWNIQQEEPHEVERTVVLRVEAKAWNGLKWKLRTVSLWTGLFLHFPHVMQKRYGIQQIPDQAWTAWHHAYKSLLWSCT